MLKRTKLFATLLGLSLMAAPAMHTQAELPDPDGKPADMTKPVQVFIVMGQSNTLEMGNVSGDKDGALEKAVKDEGLYPFLVDDSGNWTTRKDVRNVSVMQKRGPSIYRNEWLSVIDEKNGKPKKKIGIEIGIGNVLGEAIDAPVMILKSSIGNRSLGWDILPPGSERFEFEDVDKKTKETKTYVYPAYKDEVRHSRWEKGNVPEPPTHGWYAGLQYDADVKNAKDILADFDKYYPGANGYEIAGFIWWQGDKDRYDAGHASRYGKNLVTLINALRKDFDAPDAKFVCATLGQTSKEDASGNEKKIFEGMFSLLENSELKDDVAVVYGYPLTTPAGASNGHYGGSAKTYLNVGMGLGAAMADLVKDEK